MCRVKGASFVLGLALLSGLVARAIPSWPVAQAQELGDGNPQQVEFVLLTGSSAPVSNRIDHVTSFAVEELKGVKFVVLKTASREKLYFAADKLALLTFKPEG